MINAIKRLLFGLLAVCFILLTACASDIPQSTTHDYDQDGICNHCGHKVSVGLHYGFQEFPYGYSVSIGTCQDANIVIPETYNGRPVTSIHSFQNCTFLTDITLPNGLLAITGGAFDSCTGLTSIVIPDSVITIDDYAFKNCSSLSSITIPDSVSHIPFGCFEGCTKLIQVENGVSYVNEWVIDCDPEIATPVIREGTTRIANGAFGNCTKLTSITIPDGVTDIGALAFRNCQMLTSVTIPESVTKIDPGSFRDCIRLREIHYEGTRAQWEYISKDCRFDSSITIYCMNAEI